MADKIFSKVASVKKKDLMPTLVNLMITAGWQRLNTGHASTGASRYIMKSNGKTGDKPIYFELLPYDGNNVIGNATYDIRTTDYTDGQFRMGSGYDPTTGMLTGPFSTTLSSQVFSLIGGRASGSDNNANGRLLNKDYECDLYYYIDLDFVVIAVCPLVYTGMQNCMTFFGIPEKEYLDEVKTPVYSNIIYGTSGLMTEGAQAIKVLERPKSFARNNAGYNLVSQALIPALSPNVDGNFQLSDIYYGKSDEGIRGRIGNGFYVIPHSGIVDGDIIQVVVGGVTQQYRFVKLPVASSNWTSLPVITANIGISVAIRIA